MRNSIVSWAVAAAIALGVPVVASSAANAESVMRLCATQWKEAQGAGTTGGQTWPQFLAQCRASQNGAAAAPASAPAPAQSGSLIPWWQPSAPASAPASNVGGATAGQSVMRLCASQWKDAKAAGTTGGQTWPQFLAQCRASRSAAASPSGGFAPAPAPCPKRPPLSRARCFHGGSRRPTRRRRTSALLQPCERASTRPSFRRVRPARQTRSCGSTRRRASTTIREPTITGTHAGAPICAKPMRGRADFARRGIANVRPRRLRAEGAAHGHRRALTEQLVSGHRLFPPTALTASFDARAAALFTDEICPAERTRRVVIERQNCRRRCVTRLTVRHAEFMPNSLSPR